MIKTKTNLQSCLLSMLLVILTLMTSCSGLQSQATFKETADNYGFSTLIDRLDSANMTAYKNGCRVNFYEFETTTEAKQKYDKFLTEAHEIENRIKSNQRESTNIFIYQHYSVKTAKQLFYATQYRNTLLYFNGDRSCENQLEKLFEKLGY